jgi:tetratricopeptide (TPR) repeat protein
MKKIIEFEKQEDITRLINEGRECMEQESNPTEAKKKYSAALHLESDNAQALIGLGNALNRLGDLNQAIEQYKKAANINKNYKDSLEALTIIGQTYYTSKEYQHALEAFEQAINKALSYLKNKPHKEQRKTINQQIELAYEWQGQIFIEQQNYKDAILRLKQAKKITNKNYINHDIASCYFCLENLPKALKYYRESNKLSKTENTTRAIESITHLLQSQKSAKPEFSTLQNDTQTSHSLQNDEQITGNTEIARDKIQD